MDSLGRLLKHTYGDSSAECGLGIQMKQSMKAEAASINGPARLRFSKIKKKKQNKKTPA